MFYFLYAKPILILLNPSGRCIGAIIGGIVSEAPALDAAREVYRALAVTSLVIAAAYLALYHFVLAPKCQAPSVAPPQTLLQGKLFFMSQGTIQYNVRASDKKNI